MYFSSVAVHQLNTVCYIEFFAKSIYVTSVLTQQCDVKNYKHAERIIQTDYGNDYEVWQIRSTCETSISGIIIMKKHGNGEW